MFIFNSLSKILLLRSMRTFNSDGTILRLGMTFMMKALEISSIKIKRATLLSQQRKWINSGFQTDFSQSKAFTTLIMANTQEEKWPHTTSWRWSQRTLTTSSSKTGKSGELLNSPSKESKKHI